MALFFEELSSPCRSDRKVLKLEPFLLNAPCREDSCPPYKPTMRGFPTHGGEIVLSGRCLKAWITATVFGPASCTTLVAVLRRGGAGSF